MLPRAAARTACGLRARPPPTAGSPLAAVRPRPPAARGESAPRLAADRSRWPSGRGSVLALAVRLHVGGQSVVPLLAQRSRRLGRLVEPLAQVLERGCGRQRRPEEIRDPLERGRTAECRRLKRSGIAPAP